MFSKQRQGDYQWTSYSAAHQTSLQFGRGLVSLIQDCQPGQVSQCRTIAIEMIYKLGRTGAVCFTFSSLKPLCTSICVQPVCVYGETRAEWLLAALGMFSQNLVLATLYTNLGLEAVQHGITETAVTVVSITLRFLFDICSFV